MAVKSFYDRKTQQLKNLDAARCHAMLDLSQAQLNLKAHQREEEREHATVCLITKNTEG